MVVTIDTLAVAADLKLGDGETALEEPIAGTLTRLLATATALVVLYAPSAGDAVHNTSAALVCAYLYDKPTASIGNRFADAVSNSGAAALLAPYRSRTVTVID